MESQLEQAEEMAVDAALVRVRINYRWLLKLRWTAVVGQLLTVLCVMAFVSRDLPETQLAIIVGATALTNLFLATRFQRSLANPSQSALRMEAELVAIMAFDVLLFSSLLFFTGGAENPFSIFYLVHVVLGAIVLEAKWAWALSIECVVCFLAVFVWHSEFPEIQGLTNSENARQWGSLAAFLTVALTIAWFVVHFHEELSKREQDLLDIRQKRSQQDRIEALVTLAAGAAHELSTPLSTIAVAAGELQYDLEKFSRDSGLGQEAVADVNLIRLQVKRCRDILEQMSADSGELSGEPMVTASLGQLLSWTIDPIPNGNKALLSMPDLLKAEPVVFPRKALSRALRGLITNALDAGNADHEVEVEISRRGDIMQLVVTDKGPGMSLEVSNRAFEPFFTTKSPGRGMGLGLYLSRSVVERLDGTIELIKTGREGTVMQVMIPLFSKKVGAEPQEPDSDRQMS
ncbi:MAG: two-component system sensor histidine kinase RegB [Planctomycetota bacterium]|jgi:two-component system sensor histidine kinase RegB